MTHLWNGSGILGAGSVAAHEINCASKESTELDTARQRLLALDAAQQKLINPQNRELAVATLEALIQLARCEIPGLQLMAAEELAWQLSDLDVGIQGPMVTEKKPASSERPTRGVVLRVFSAAYLQMLREAKVPMDEAKRRATARFANLCQVGKPSTIVNWRKQLLSARGKGCGDVDVELFERVLNAWRSNLPEPGKPTERDADRWVEELN